MTENKDTGTQTIILEDKATDTVELDDFYDRAFPSKEELADLKKDVKQGIEDFIKGFKKFSERGPLIELAIGGMAVLLFNGLVKSFSEDILTPPLELLTGKSGSWSYSTLKQAQEDGAVTENYGQFIQILINFFMSMLTLFIFLRISRSLNLTKPTLSKKCPYCKESIDGESIRCKNCTSFLCLENEPQLYVSPETLKKSSPTITSP